MQRGHFIHVFLIATKTYYGDQNLDVHYFGEAAIDDFLKA